LQQRLARFSPWTLAEMALIALVAMQAARLLWAVMTPLGPVGYWHPPGAKMVTANPAFDPFFRLAGAADNSAVTALPLKLFGVRVDEATGRGSAIIATPDGVQSSFGIGDEVVPGVHLKLVASDHAVLDRRGAEEQIFLDQSVPAPVAAAPAAPPVPASAPAGKPAR
jgi:general secretion pathway protein C